MRSIGPAFTIAVATLVAATTTHAASELDLREATKPSQSGGYALRSTLALGGPDAPDEAQFFEKLGRIGVDADAQGNVYVLDNGNLRIQVFDASGKFLRSFGHEGEGPGEFKMPSCFSVNALGEVALYDMMTQRVSVLDSEGKLLRDRIVDRPVKGLLLRDDGSLVLAYGGKVAPKFEALSASNASLWQYGGEPPKEEGGRGFNFEISTGAEGQLVGGARDLVVCGLDQEYGLIKVENGAPSAGWKRPFERQAMPSMEEMARARGKKDGESGGPRRVVMIRHEDGANGVSTSVQTGHAGEKQITLHSDDIADMMPKFQPDLRGLLVWPDGRIWAMTSEKHGDKVVTDEWSRSGEYLKRFELSGEYDWLEIGADGALYGLTHDKDDFPIVHRLTVEAE